MRLIHIAVGWSIVIAFGVLWLWGLGAAILRRGPGRPFWWILAYVQVTLLLQFLAGTVLYFLGGRASLLHYVYGIFWPFVLLLLGHAMSRDQFADRSWMPFRFAHRPWVPFAVIAFFCWGLTLRALMTGSELA